MSFIHTALGDISNSSPSEILERSLGNEAPFDVPTIVLSSEEFANCSEKQGRIYRFFRDDMVAHMQSRLQDFFGRQDKISQERAEEITREYIEAAPEHILPKIVSNLIIPQYVQSGCVLFPFKGITGPFAHQATEDFKDADSGMVFTFNKSVDGRAYGESMLQLGENELPEMPGTAEEWQFLLLWHEFSHTTGAAEPHADKIAAIASRQAFAKSDIISALADQRMATAILKHHDDIQISYYGLPLVENLDAVVTMPEDDVQTLDANAVKNIRFETHDYRPHKVRQVGQSLANAFPEEFKNIREHRHPVTMSNLAAFAEKASGIAKDTPDPDIAFIATRFVTAIERLSTGKTAYTPG